MGSSRPAGLPLEALGLHAAASGNLTLNLTETISWEEFERYARSLLRLLRGKTISTADSVEMRVWDVSISGQALALVWNDYPAMVSLESSSEGGDAVLKRVQAEFAVLASSSADR